MISMKESNPSILVLSSVSPTIGPAIIGEQIYEALKRKGLDVDFMTKYPEPNHPEYLWVVRRENSIKKLFLRIVNKIRWFCAGVKYIQPGYFFFYTYEDKPPVPSSCVLKVIKKKYDLVIIVFWQELLSFKTVEQIYDKLHCQIQFGGVDYSHMSGGCHFTGECQNYKTGCGMCPAFHSKLKNDFTAWNVKYRKRVYKKVKPVVWGNLYMSQFYKESFLLKEARIEIGGSPIIDTDTFRPLDKNELRKKFDISDEKKYVIFFGCQNLDDERKGIRYFFEALVYLKQMMGASSDSVLVVTAGKDYEKIKKHIPFDSRGFGYVSMHELPELYSVASCFVCSSINDAGPMMVNQSLCCGTPVVGFDMGAVKQVVKNHGSGICVPLKDSRGLAEGILQILRMAEEDYQMMSQRAREIALATSSYEAHADSILSTFRKYKN